MKYIKSLDKKTETHLKYLQLADKKTDTHDHLLVACAACVLLLTAAQILGNKGIIFASIFFYLAIITFCDPLKMLPCILFFFPWSPIMKLSPSSITFTSVATLIIIIRCIYEGWILEIRKFIPVVLLAILTLFSKFFHGYSISTSYLMFFVTMLMYGYFLPNIKTKTSFEYCIVYYSVGIILATIMSVIFQENSNIKNYVIIQTDAYSVKRLTGFVGDANFYSAQIVPAFTGALIIIFQKNSHSKRYALLAIGLAIMGVIAVSKSFLICMAIVLFLFVVNMVFSDGKNIIRLIPASVLIIGFVIGSGLFSDIIESYTTRFTMSTNMEKLTTGRDLLWLDYISFMIKNPIELIFGQGLTSVFNVVYKGSHNSIIQCFYQLGIFGTLFLSIWFFWLIRVEDVGGNFLSYILWVVGCFSMWMGVDVLFFDDFFCIISLFSIGLNSICKYGKQNCKMQKELKEVINGSHSRFIR